jgi:F420-non-reducing hydrogenase small subunit
MQQFAVLQLTGCAGCEVSLLNAEEWLEEYELVYMPLVISANSIPDVDILLVSGGVRTDDDLYRLRRAVPHAKKVVAVGTCAISGGVVNLGNRDEVRELFLAEEDRRHLPRLLPRCRPIAEVVPIQQTLPGCPPTPELFVKLLFHPKDLRIAKTVCRECGRKKHKEMRPRHLAGVLHGSVLPDICLINQGYLCIGISTRGGCHAPCTNAGQPCVGCRGPSDAFIHKEPESWLNAIWKIFSKMTDVPQDEIETALRSPQLSLFLFQFSHDALTGAYPDQNVEVL